MNADHHARGRSLAQTWLRVGYVRLLAPLMLVLGVLQGLLPQVVTGHQLRAIEESDMPTALIVSTVAGISAAHSVIEPEHTIWRLAPSGRRWLGQLRVIALLAILAGVVGLASTEDLPSLLNVSFTTAGEALLVTAAVDYRLAWTLPAAHAAASSLLGLGLFANLGWWAWIADPTPTPKAVTCSLLPLLAGLGATRTLGRAARF